jgi:ribosomal protein S13
MMPFLQIDTTTVATQATEQLSTKPELSVMDIVFSGGIAGQTIMGAIFIMLFFAIYLYFERLMAINAASKIDSNFMNNIKMDITKNRKTTCRHPRRHRKRRKIRNLQARKERKHAGNHFWCRANDRIFGNRCRDGYCLS